MSYDLCCWRQKGHVNDSPQLTYESLCDDEEPDGLAWLDLDEIRTEFSSVFPSIDIGSTELAWENHEGSFQVVWPIGSISDHCLCFFVLCSWSLATDTEIMSQIRKVGKALGCCIYDPQTNILALEVDEEGSL